MQDVAIDALAVSTLHEHERGTGQRRDVRRRLDRPGDRRQRRAVPHRVHRLPADVLLRRRLHPGGDGARGAAACARQPARRGSRSVGSRLAAAGARDARASRSTSFRSFLGTRGAFSGLLLRRCCPPARCAWGCRCSRTSRSSSASTTTRWPGSTLWSALISAVAHGRRRLPLRPLRAAPHAGRSTSPLMGLPVLYLMAMLSQHGWVMPVSPQTRQPAGRAGRAGDRAVDRLAHLQRRQRPDVRHALGDLHGRDQPARSRRRSSPPTWR